MIKRPSCVTEDDQEGKDIPGTYKDREIKREDSPANIEAFLIVPSPGLGCSSMPQLPRELPRSFLLELR